MVRVVITMSDDGKFNVEGPLDNKFLMYGIIGTLSEMVAKRHPEPAKIIQPAITFPGVPGSDGKTS